MIGGWRSDHRPPWWPENEPFPPAHRGRGWHRARGRFARRIGCLFAALLVLSVIGATTVVTTLMSRTGLEGASLQVPLLALLASALLLMLIAVFVGTMRRVGLPLSNIVEAADRVARGDFTARLAERGPRSLRLIAHAFNSMTARLQAQDRQRRQLMADVAHELRTPLSVIQGRLEGLLDGVYPRDDDRLNELLEDTKTLARLVEDLRTLANAESGMLPLHKEPTDLAVLIQEVVDSFAAEADSAGVSVGADAGSHGPLVDVDPLRIRQVLVNLVSNAIHHTPRGGTVRVAAAMEAERAVVTVSDTGSGIPAEELPRIFDRFYKGRTSRGSGLGLTIVKNLVLAHGGEISAASRSGEGTTVTVALPVR